MRRPLKVYLAGGLYGDWQDEVMQADSFNYYYLNPRTSGMEEPEDYAAWDIGNIFMCDILFLYIAPDNPGGHNAFFEAGIAAGLGKRIIFVNEKQEIERYTRMLQVVAEFYACKLEHGIGYLKQLASKRDWFKGIY